MKKILLSLLAAATISMTAHAASKTEAEQQIALLQSMINPGKTHEFAAKLLAGFVGNRIFSNKVTQQIQPEIEGCMRGIMYNLPCAMHSRLGAVRVNPYNISMFSVLLADRALALKLQEYLLKNETQDRFVAGFGGIGGTALHALYHKLFFSNKRCLERTLEAFKKAPTDFPPAAQTILENASLTFKNMDAKEIALVCAELRKIGQTA